MILMADFPKKSLNLFYFSLSLTGNYDIILNDNKTEKKTFSYSWVNVV
jgi:hypothetical protein